MCTLSTQWQRGCDSIGIMIFANMVMLFVFVLKCCLCTKCSDETVDMTLPVSVSSHVLFVVPHSTNQLHFLWLWETVIQRTWRTNKTLWLRYFKEELIILVSESHQHLKTKNLRFVPPLHCLYFLSLTGSHFILMKWGFFKEWVSKRGW